MRRSVLVVEDQALMASLLSDALGSAGFDVHHAPDVPSALEAIEDFDPDAAVLDIDLGPGPTGFDLGTVLARTRPDIALLFLTDKPESALMPFHVTDIPANAGFLLKGQVCDLKTLVEALEAVLHDRPDLARHAYDTPGLEGLTPEQLELLRGVAMGLTNGVIARRHGVAESTVERWIVALLRQLGICSRNGVNPRVEAARRYIAACGLPAAQ
jgi:DNA-binding NarL/FixJ family response regulator